MAEKLKRMTIVPFKLFDKNTEKRLLFNYKYKQFICGVPVFVFTCIIEQLCASLNDSVYAPIFCDIQAFWHFESV